MAITRLDISSRSPFADGASFGDVGPYELVEGTVQFAVDPRSAHNEVITDIEFAPRDVLGKVVFSSDFAMLRPISPEKGNRRILFDVVNRGQKTVLNTFNRSERPANPAAPLQPGNGFLMRRGYTVVWCGWQADVPPTPGLMGMQVPEATDQDGKPIKGRILCQFQCNEPTPVFMLSHRGHTPHPPAEIDDPFATLTVRELPKDPPELISRDKWSFVRVEDEETEPEPCHISLSAGFEPGKLYQLAYETEGAAVIGLGLTAIRDIVSFLKYEKAKDINPCAGDVEYAYAFGQSQSGRLLRELIYLGLNEDEKRRVALDGIIAHVAGGLRGEFNIRFGQPSQDICYINPQLFPSSDFTQTDPVTGKRDGLLENMKKTGQIIPKIMLTNTSAEYWRGDAALIHTDLESETDAPESEWVRRYHFSGAQHGSGNFPPLEVRPLDGIRGQLPFNILDYSPLLRAALSNLDRWVTTGEAPPPSRHPRLSNGSAVESYTLAGKFSKLPGVRFPPKPLQAIRLDHGPETHLGRLSTLPAIQGEVYAALVSDVDDSYNDLAGIRLPHLSVPVATYSGWNLRHPDIGNPNLYIGISGGLAGWTLGLPATRAARDATGDPRLSIEERYASKEDYLAQVREASRFLIEEGYLLSEDIERVEEQAGKNYDYFRVGAKG